MVKKTLNLHNFFFSGWKEGLTFGNSRHENSEDPSSENHSEGAFRCLWTNAPCWVPIFYDATRRKTWNSSSAQSPPWKITNQLKIIITMRMRTHKFELILEDRVGIGIGIIREKMLNGELSVIPSCVALTSSVSLLYLQCAIRINRRWKKEREKEKSWRKKKRQHVVVVIGEELSLEWTEFFCFGW